eukprot:4353228-Alexandrium_andersonii.AAC.1
MSIGRAQPCAGAGKRCASAWAPGRPQQPTWTARPTGWSTTPTPSVSGRRTSRKGPGRSGVVSTSGRSA